MRDSHFVSGLQLSRAFFEEVVRERADQLLGADRYAAALTGPGSEVLGLDDDISTDHDWGPRVILVVAEADLPRVDALVHDLPPTFCDHPLNFAAKPDVRPWTVPVYATTLDRLFSFWVGFNPLGDISTVDWLAAPAQGLLSMTAGEVFHDGPGELTAARRQLAWYPDEIWMWMLACQWKRISQEDAFVGRAAHVDDELGAQLLAARISRDAIRLAFLLERRYAPYSKWLAKAAAAWLEGGPELLQHLKGALSTRDTHVRQAALVDAQRVLGDKTNRLFPDLEVDCSPRNHYTRPYIVGPAGHFASGLLAKVTDPDLRQLPEIGAVDQVVDSTDASLRVSRGLYQSLLRDR